MASNRPSGTQTHEPTHQALRPRQPPFALHYRTLGAAFLAYFQLPQSTHHPAPPTRRHDQSCTRPQAGRHSRTKSTLSVASIDANPPANALRLGPVSLPAAPRPIARRTLTPRPPSPPSGPRKHLPLSSNSGTLRAAKRRVRCTQSRCSSAPVAPTASCPHEWGLQRT